MRHYCTYFDVNYLTRALALHESLQRHSKEDFVLWVLCFDEPTHDALSQMNVLNIKTISFEEFERDDLALQKAKKNRTIVEYYWTCTPSLPLYVFRQNPEIDEITYVDADLYFFSDPKPVFEEFGHGSVLIIEHRFTAELRHLEVNGVFNVGLMIFRRDANGLAALDWWRDRCLEWCYARCEGGKFGDQKYLDDWPTRFSGVVVLQHKGAGLAPWNLSGFPVEFSADPPTVAGEPLIFFHYHGYRQVSRHAVIPASDVYPISLAAARRLYLRYAHALRAMQKRLDHLGITIPSERIKTNDKHLVMALLNQDVLLTRPKWLSVLLWRIGAWNRTNSQRVKRGFEAYTNGDLSTACRYFLSSMRRNPLVLLDRSVLSILMEPLLGSGRVDRLRHLRRRLSRSYSAKNG